MTHADAALTVLADVLADLSAALGTGRADDVLQVEPRLAAALDGVRAAGAVPGGATHALVARVRAHVAGCRRLGGTVPALLSVMFPGQVSYGRPAGPPPIPVTSIARMG